MAQLPNPSTQKNTVKPKPLTYKDLVQWISHNKIVAKYGAESGKKHQDAEAMKKGVRILDTLLASTSGLSFSIALQKEFESQEFPNAYEFMKQTGSLNRERKYVDNILKDVEAAKSALLKESGILTSEGVHVDDQEKFEDIHNQAPQIVLNKMLKNRNQK